MKIVVCIKQVPDTTEVKLDPKTGTLIRDGIPSIMNPDDKGGLEHALQLKDEYGAEVTVITMGPPQADAVLREAFAMGADRAILLTSRKFAGADTLATSNALAGALKVLDFDLVLAGRQAIDGDTAQVGPQIAEHLGKLLGGLEVRRKENAPHKETIGGRLSNRRSGHPLSSYMLGVCREASLHERKRHHGGLEQRSGDLGYR